MAISSGCSSHCSVYPASIPSCAFPPCHRITVRPLYGGRRVPPARLHSPFGSCNSKPMRRGLFSLSMKIMGGGVVSACCWEHTGATFDHTVHINTRDVCRFCGPSVTGLACGDAFAGTPRTSLFAGLCCALHEQCCNARRHADKE